MWSSNYMSKRICGFLVRHSNITQIWSISQPAYNIYTCVILLLQHCYPLPPTPSCLYSLLWLKLTQSLSLSVWTFETNGHGQESRDNPSRLCKYQCACLQLNVNALIWNANCVLCDMLKHWRAALWDGKLKAGLSPLFIPTGPFDCGKNRQVLASCRALEQLLVS